MAHDPAALVRLPAMNAGPIERVASPAEFAELLAALLLDLALPYALAGYGMGRRAQIIRLNRYELRLSPPPPVDAFWSLTMYDATDFYLVANPINRYSIGDRTAGLHTEADGSVTIYIQPDAPDSGRQSNWLPTPAGRFRPLMRMYQPRPEILNSEYTLPAITKAR